MCSLCCFRLRRTIAYSSMYQAHGLGLFELFWLHGGADVGKSSLAQSLSEKWDNFRLAFSSNPTRDKRSSLIPTLVSHLIDTVEGIAPFVMARFIHEEIRDSN